MAEKSKKSKAEKMYGNPPETEQDDEGGFHVKPGKANQTQAGTEGESEHEAAPVEHEHKMMDMHHRHEMEHMSMNRRHEVEHHASGGKDESMVEKHVHEHKEMNTRHIAELKKAHKHGKEGGGEPVKNEDKKALEGFGKEKKAKAEKGGEKE